LHRLSLSTQSSNGEEVSVTEKQELVLGDGSRVAVIGGGPAGSFFSYFFLDMARRVDIDVAVDIYEAKNFTVAGPTGCNNCAGIISESLVQTLAAEGINLPPTVVKTGIDSYVLHMDVGSVNIETPLHEMRIAAVHRGAGPRGIKDTRWRSFDGYLLGLAADKGANIVTGRVDEISWDGLRPQVKVAEGTPRTYDLLVVAAGLNPATLKLLENMRFGYKSPKTTKTFICELYLGEETVQKQLGNAVHLFLLDIPRLDFAMLIPKVEFATFCMLGQDIDNTLVQATLDSPEVRACLPADWQMPEGYCRCAPRTNTHDAANTFADRVVIIGDSGVTRLYKDGIGAAYRAAKAAAVTAVFDGVSAEDFHRHYWPSCQATSHDNRYGKLIFSVTRQVQRRRFMRRGILQTVTGEQRKDGASRRLSMVFWDTFTGSAHYRDVFLRTLHPVSVGRLAWNSVAALVGGFRGEKR
jgi:flavin-dependent dehydrogenase